MNYQQVTTKGPYGHPEVNCHSDLALFDSLVAVWLVDRMVVSLSPVNFIACYILQVVVSYLNVLFNFIKSYCIIRTFLLCKWSLTINYWLTWRVFMLNCPSP